MIVNVVQYLMPDGRTKNFVTEVPDDLAAQYEAMQKAGYRLTAEVLTTGEVSVTIEGADGDRDIELCVNGEPQPGSYTPSPAEGIARMLRRFHC